MAEARPVLPRTHSLPQRLNFSLSKITASYKTNPLILPSQNLPWALSEIRPHTEAERQPKRSKSVTFKILHSIRGRSIPPKILARLDIKLAARNIWPGLGEKRPLIWPISVTKQRSIITQTACQEAKPNQDCLEKKKFFHSCTLKSKPSLLEGFIPN